MRKIILYAGLTAILTLLSAGRLSAQRTAEGSLFVGVSPTVSVYQVPSGGADLYVGGYLRSSCWKAGVRSVDWNHVVDADSGSLQMFDHLAWAFYGGWRYRVLGTYNRALSFYAGADIFLGLNQYEVFRSLPEELTTGLPGCEFIYGVTPELELEFFVGRRTALVLGAQLPVALGSSISSDKWNLTGSLGIRFNINRR